MGFFDHFLRDVRSVVDRYGTDRAIPPLDGALSLRIARPAKLPADAQLAAQRGELRCRLPIAGAEAGLAVPDQPAGQAADLPQTAGDAPEQIRRLLGEDQRARAGARVAQTRDDHPAAAVLDPADRQRVLEGADAATRLRTVLALLRRETAIVGRFGALPTPPDPGGASLN